MKQYLDVLQDTLYSGHMHKNRTGVPTVRKLGAMLEMDLHQGFPLLTTKKMAWGQIKGELFGFLRGYTSAEDFRALGCNIWDANANKNSEWLGNPNRKGEDDLGRIYGAQWRNWNGQIDQIANAIEMIKSNPTSRRNIVSAWNPMELAQMALPPCHVLFQFHVEGDQLSLTMYQRSCDMFLGVPFNIASYALLTHLVAHVCGLDVGTLVMFLADVHIYMNHVDQVEEQLTRTPKQLPAVRIEGPKDIDKLGPDNIEILFYNPYPPIVGEMVI